MTQTELKQAIRQKTLEFEVAIELGKPHKIVKTLYKELKELQYQLTVLEASPKEQTDQTVA